MAIVSLNLDKKKLFTSRKIRSKDDLCDLADLSCSIVIKQIRYIYQSVLFNFNNHLINRSNFSTDEVYQEYSKY